MKIKQIIAGVMLTLPFAVISLPTEASASELIARKHIHRSQGRARVVVPARRRVVVPARRRVVVPQARRRVVVPTRRRVWVPARWENTRYGRRMIPGRYIYR
ncbi:hypothetical protein QUB80_21035 [Chlorogloeopsis sp. ULAP01]|uniref:hypothetical protein n=1 Tax=Chlorogloeopsis sp. ULAP01 TaxID=3056483 RepID=UPI0025AA9642|nr:hypothetical protein [Chlorogloeopsis sp. ULAP01]MDM9383183.1 hypothetical protein [Chlorogloeopsis sp. ULAP01]